MIDSPPAHILFVDDEPRILDGLRRSLRGMRHSWQMQFAGGGAEALAMLEQGPCDVLVSDMRMPGMDGAELLTRVRAQYPAVARVVLSGHTEPDAAVRAALVAHRFLNKPCEVQALTQVVSQLTSGLTRSHARQLRQIAGAVRTLPSAPQQAAELTQALDDPELTLGGLMDLAHGDVALTGKVLQMANSAFFGARPRVVSVGYSLTTLGLPMVRALLRAPDATWTWPDGDDDLHAALQIGWEHSYAVSLLSRQVATPALAPFVEVAATLLDVGRLAAVAHDPRAVAADLREARSTGRRMEDVASGRCGFGWSDLAAELLTLWGLPQPVVAALAGQQDHDLDTGAGLGAAGALRASQLLIQRTDSADPARSRDDRELQQLLEHPQLRNRGIDWDTAAATAARAAQARCRPLSVGRRTSPISRDTRGPQDTPREAPQILVVDDDSMIRQLLVDILDIEGFSTRTAEDGETGLQQIAGSRPDCVLLDVMMPGLSGFEVLEQIRGMPGPALPVVMLTAAADAQTASAAWAGGADFFLSKPFDPDELVGLINRLFDRDAVSGAA